MIARFLTLFLSLNLGMAYAITPTAELTLKNYTTEEWPAHYQLTLSIPADHHAYLDKGIENAYIPIELDPRSTLSDQNLVLQDLNKPKGVYDKDVKATVLRNTGNFDFALTTTRPDNEITKTSVGLRYQLCNELTNVCYRPQSVEVTLPLPTASAPVDDMADSMSLTERIVEAFHKNQNNTFIIFGLMFLAGLLSVATPCVYPMLPITSMYIVGRANGNHSKEKQHAFIYLVGIIGTYMLLGLIAGMTGGAFNTFMQSAFVNLVFALFFAFFALSLLGFYELSFMQNEVHVLDQHSAKVKGLAGTWLMGSVAGLVISPCVGPIVFALLLQVADNIAEKTEALALLKQSIGFWDKFTIAGQGSLMMSGFGLGVGLPFFIFSIVRFKSIPKAGYWMNKVKYAFGFAILYFAYTYFSKGMTVLGVGQTTIITLAISLIAIWLAIVHFNVLTVIPEQASPNERLYRFCGVVTLLTGGWLFFSSMEHMPFIKDASAYQQSQIAGQQLPAESNIQPAVSEGGITWYRNLSDARKMAVKLEKPIFVDFYAGWCANCVAFAEETVHNKSLNTALKEDAIALKLIDGEPEFEKFRNHPEHRQLKIGLPYFAILKPDGSLVWSGSDYKATETMVDRIGNLKELLS